MKKSAQVVMLPTNEKADIVKFIGEFQPGKVVYVPDIFKRDKDEQNQHLYILSDEPIKEGDWFLMNGCIIRQCALHKGDVLDTIGGLHHESVCKKIIATTDRMLKIGGGTGKREDGISIPLPQPSQSFIEHFVAEYNKGNIITKVLVEYEELLDSNSVNQMMFSGMNIKDATTELNLKINPDNTINIKPIKESWSREEVTTLLYSLNRDKEGNFDCTKWIEENL
jgi:hypothetical protein